MVIVLSDQVPALSTYRDKQLLEYQDIDLANNPTVDGVMCRIGQGP